MAYIAETAKAHLHRTRQRERDEEEKKMVMVKKEETRKGPWTEQEDLQLVCFVRLLGERRWDFIAKVSGLNRTGKSCRLRWVNYLQPGLKRGRVTPQEERIILDLHSRWGNRWSRIASKLPGRTDNEIKNYWRTHMRKKAQEQKRNSSSSSYSSSSSSSSSPSSPSTSPTSHSSLVSQHHPPSSSVAKEKDDHEVNWYSMDQIWNEIDTSEACNVSCPVTMSFPTWEYCPDTLWIMED